MSEPFPLKRPAPGFTGGSLLQLESTVLDTGRPASTGSRSVAILLCTLHGHHYLADQIDSIVQQNYANWSIWASDDGSLDGTHSILQDYQRQLGKSRLTVHFGPAEGFVANFLSLICHASITADYYAFADQDDIWEKDKLSRATEWLNSVPEHVPAMYCSRTRNVDSENRDIGLSRLFFKSPSFANALVQNIGGGNTMVFNNAARKLLCIAGADINVVSHDWWVYLVVTGCGGVVFYDPKPSVRYRQHSANLIGASDSLSDSLARARLLMDGRFKTWTDINLRAISHLYDYLTPVNQRCLELFSKSRQGTLIPRMRHLRASGVYRQSLLGQLGLYAAAMLKKI